jgi:hypothetical protein
MVKVSLLLSVLALAFGGCRGVTLEPELGDGSAVIPLDGAQYVYSYKVNGAKDSTLETVRMECVGKSKFIAQRNSKSAAIRLDTFRLREDGDLEWFLYDEVFPVGTRGSYAIVASTPLQTSSGSLDLESTLRYDGADSVAVGDSSFLCSRIVCDRRISSPSRTSTAHVTYWYSAKAAFFVLEQSRSTTNSELNYDRRLVRITN